MQGNVWLKRWRGREDGAEMLGSEGSREGLLNKGKNKCRWS